MAQPGLAPGDSMFHLFIGQPEKEAHGDTGIAFDPINLMIKSGIKQIDIATAR
jgi:hypothetical protein